MILHILYYNMAYQVDRTDFIERFEQQFRDMPRPMSLNFFLSYFSAS